jgi:TP901 family phage tail tape measure protein
MAANVVEIVITSTNKAGAGIEESADQAEEAAAAWDAYADAATRAAEANTELEAAAARLAGVQADEGASGEELAAVQNEYAAALDRASTAATASLDAQMRLAAAERDSAAAAKESSDAQEESAAKTDESSESAGMFAGAWGKAKLALLGVAGAMVYGTVKAAGFQSVMNTLNTQAGVSRGQLASLGNGVLALAGQVGDSPDSLAQALYHVESSFASVGITGPKALNLLKTAAEGAAVGHADLVDVTNALDATIVAGVPGIKSYSGAMGALNAIVGSGDMTMQDLASAMSTGVMAVAKSFGQNIYQVGAALAVFGDNNIRGAHAATELRMAWQAMQAPLTTAGPVLKSIGLTMTELGHTMTHEGMSSAIEQFIQHLQASKVPASDWGQYMTEIFGKKAGVGIGILTDQIDRLKSKFPDLERGASGFGSAWAHTQQTVAQQWADLKSSLDALVTKMGVGLLPIAMKAVRGLTDFANALEHGKGPAIAVAAIIGGALAGIALKKLQDGLSTAAEGFENLWKGGEKLAGWAGQMIGKLTGAGDAAADAATETEGLAAAQDAQAESAEGAAAAQETLDVAEDANPIGAIIMLLVALAAGIYEVVRHWKDFEHWGSEALHGVETAARDVWSWIKANWPMLAGILLAPFTGGISLAIALIVKFHKDIEREFDDIRHDVASDLDGMRHDVAAAFDDFISTEESGLDIIRHDFASKFDQIRHDIASWGDDVVHWFEQLPGRIVNGAAALPGMLFHLGENAISGLLHGLESMVGGLIGDAENWGHDIANAIGGAFGIHFSEPSEATKMIAAGQRAGLGFAKGLASTEGALRGAAATASRAAMFGGAGGGYGGGGAGGQMEVVLRWEGAESGLIRELFQSLKAQVRVVGGGGTNSAQRAWGQTS